MCDIYIHFSVNNFTRMILRIGMFSISELFLYRLKIYCVLYKWIKTILKRKSNKEIHSIGL